LRGDGQGGTAPPDIESHSDDEVDDVDEDIDEDYDDIDDRNVENETAEKNKKKSKKAEPLPCSHSQFVGLLQDLFVFHAWYKGGAPPKEDVFRRFSYVFES
jgi:hypothetical protein